VATYVGYV